MLRGLPPKDADTAEFRLQSPAYAKTKSLRLAKAKHGVVSSVVVTTTDTHRAIEAVWRIESARIIAGLARMLRDVGLAEELAQDALVAALEQWPASGIPDNPGAWLMTAAKHSAIDRLRRSKLLERKHGELSRELQAQQE